MQPPSIVIAANPYEAELCRRALVETGLRVVVAEGGEGAIEAVRAEKPLVLVIALGIFGVEPLELLAQARAEEPKLAIFLLGDRDGEFPDEDSAARIGATRLFLRPIEVDALADAIEKRAVEAEVAEDVAEAMREFDVRPPTIDAAPLVEEAIVEMEADYRADDEEAPARALAKIALKRIPTEVMKGVIEVPASKERIEAQVGKVEATLEMDADEPTPAPQPIPDELRVATRVSDVPMPIAAPPPSVAVEPLMRADDALTDVGLQQMVVAPDFVVKHATDDPAPARIPDALKREATGERARPTFDERSTFARKLESELSAAERRLFPDSPSTVNARRDEYEDALGDIDLDALGIDTIPGIGADALDAAFDLKPRNGHGEPAAGMVRADADPRPANGSGAVAHHATLPEDEGDLATTDVATLFATLHAAGFSGAVTLLRGDGDKTLYFDAGMPVAARSTFTHDRLPDLLLREGIINKEQQARARDLSPGGRPVAQKLVELGILKSSELFATLRRHAEDILFSCFGWERGRYRLSHVEPPADERVRLSAHPWALVTEGVRRKYSLERLVELVGPTETVLTPTTLLPRALDDGAFTAAERARADLIDGERSLAELSIGAVGAPLSESGLYALAWSLVAIGAARVGDETGGTQPGIGGGGGVRAVPTLVTTPYGSATERRTRQRVNERPRDRDADRAIDKDRVMAKRAQVQDGDYFAILGLGRDASAHEVARAFERLKREFAPERFADPLRQELSDALSEIGEVLDEAHRVLADDDVRASYRAHLTDPSDLADPAPS
ncbi:MAG: response regulator receiver protein [bacterium]|nr:response regulator receiver protein [bacterium]